MTLDNDAFSIYAEETEDLKCDSFFRLIAVYWLVFML